MKYISFIVLTIAVSCDTKKDLEVISLSALEIGEQFEFVKFDFTNEPDSLYLGRMLGRNIKPDQTYSLDRIKVNPKGATMYWFRDNENKITKAFDRQQAGMVLVSRVN